MRKSCGRFPRRRNVNLICDIIRMEYSPLVDHPLKSTFVASSRKALQEWREHEKLPDSFVQTFPYYIISPRLIRAEYNDPRQTSIRIWHLHHFRHKHQYTRQHVVHITIKCNYAQLNRRRQQQKRSKQKGGGEIRPLEILMDRILDGHRVPFCRAAPVDRASL